MYIGTQCVAVMRTQCVVVMRTQCVVVMGPHYLHCVGRHVDTALSCRNFVVEGMTTEEVNEFTDIHQKATSL